jgi:hypothetical protein
VEQNTEQYGNLQHLLATHREGEQLLPFLLAHVVYAALIGSSSIACLKKCIACLAVLK